MAAAEAELVELLCAHLSNPSFIKGWEVDKRTCVGVKRNALRKAARDAKALSTKSVRSGPGWIKTIGRLRVQLAEAGESDFDGLLSEALEACTTTSDNGNQAAPAKTDQTALSALEAHVGRSDFKQKAKSREYGAAQSAAEVLRTARAAYLAALQACSSLRTAYLDAGGSLVSELEAIGEADFDGLLRQAIRALKEPLPTTTTTAGRQRARAQLLPPDPPRPPPPPPVEAPNHKPMDAAASVAPPESSSLPPSPDSLPASSPALRPVPDSPSSVVSPLRSSSAGRTKKKKPPPPRSFLPEHDDDNDDDDVIATGGTLGGARSVSGTSDGSSHGSSADGSSDGNASCVAAAPSIKPTKNEQALPPLPPLETAAVDDGCVWLGTLPPAWQAALLREAFATGATGVCGGLWTASGRGKFRGGGTVRGAHGQPYEPAPTPTRVDWTGLGLHGHHLIDYMPSGGVASSVVAAVREAATKAPMPEAARAALDAYAPDGLRIGFETMGERTIAPNGGSLCGWSADRLRAGAHDGSAKLLILLGGASSVTDSFKYAKGDADEDALRVPMAPGEMLLLHGPARGWVSAVTAFTPGPDGPSGGAGAAAATACPFDFVHLNVLDLKPLREARSDAYVQLLRRPAPPTPRDASWRWMQCSYTVEAPATTAGDLDDNGRRKVARSAGTPMIQLVGHKA